MTERISNGAPTDAPSFAATGTAGAGNFTALPQSAPPTAGTSLRIYADASSRLSWRAAGQPATLDTSALTTQRTFSYPDVSGVVQTQNNPATLSNKTILSTDGNTVDATRIAGQTVSGVFGAGTVLANTAPGWAPLSLTASAPLSYSSGNYSVAVGTTAGTVAAGDDLRFSTPQVLVVKATGAGAGEYSTIAAAFAAITDSGPTKPYVVQIAPGVYPETALTVPAYTVVSGSGLSATIVYRTSIGPVFAYSDNSSIRDLAIVAQEPSAVAIVANSATNIFLTRVAISGYSVGINMLAAAETCNLVMTSVSIVGATTYGVYVDGRAITGLSPCSVNINTVQISGTGEGLRIEGPQASAIIASCGLSGHSCGLRVQDGASSTATSLRITNCTDGVICGNVGAAPTTYFDSVAIIGCTNDISVLHPNATGSFSGLADNGKVSIATTANFPFDFIDSANMSATILGDLNYRPATGAATTEIGELITYGAPLGLYAGGVISVGVGRTINVSAGAGYIALASFPNQYLVRVAFSSYTSPTLAPDTTFYVYADANGVSTSLSAPSDITTVLLGRVRTTATDIEFIDSQRYSSFHPSNANLTTFRSAIGALYSTGSIVQGNGLRQLTISSGQYYYLNNQYSPSGQAFPATFFTYYHSAGGWTRAAATIVDNSQYDNGTNLVALPAGQFTKHTLYICGEGATEQYFLVYGQTPFASSAAAEAGDLPNPPPWFVDGIFKICGLVVGSNVGTIVSFLDLRPVLGSSGGSFGAITDHGNLTGLADDDHLQYLLVNGSRPMSGALAMGGNAITGAGTINGVNIATHGSRHLPNGADPITTAAPLTTLSASTTNAVGTANSLARSDHTHAINISTFAIGSLSGTLQVSKGGTGATTLAAGNFLTGNDTGAVTATKVAPTGVVVGTTDTQTLTNKTITGSTNTVESSALRTTGAPVGVSAAAPPATGQVLTAISATTAQWQTPATALSDATTAIVDSLDPSIAIKFNAAGAASTATTIATAQTANQTTTIPNTLGLADTFVLADVPQTLTNKTLTQPTISTINNGGALTLPAGPATIVARDSADTLTNKVIIGSTNNVEANALRTTGTAVSISAAAPPATGQVLTATSATTATWQTPGNLVDTSTFILDSTNPTCRLGFDVQGSASSTTTLITSQTENISLTLPSATGALVSNNFAASLTNKTITGNTNVVEASALRTTGAAVVVAGAAPPVAGRALVATGATSAAWQAVGDVVGPASATDNAITRYDGTTGKLIQSSGVLLDDTANIIGAASLRGPLNTPIIALSEISGATEFIRCSNNNVAETGPLIETIGPLGPLGPSVVPLRFGCQTDDAADAVFEFFSTESTRSAKKIRLSLAEGASGVAELHFSGGAVYTWPSLDGQVVTNNAGQQLSNKVLLDTTTYFGSTSDASKQIRFNSSANNSGRVVTITTNQTNNSSIVNIPNLTATDDTFCMLNATQTLTGKTLTQPTISSILNGGVITIPAGASTLVTTTATQTLTNKTLTLPVISSISNSGTVTIPTGTYTLVGANLTQTLSNKSLLDNSTFIIDPIDASKRVAFSSSAAAAGASLTLVNTQTTAQSLIIPNVGAGDALVSRLTSQALFNKTLTDATNNIVANSLRNATGTVSTAASPAPAASYPLIATSGTTAIWGFRSVQRPANITSNIGSGTIGSITATLSAGNYLLECSFSWEGPSANIGARLSAAISSPAVVQVYNEAITASQDRFAVSIRRLYLSGELAPTPTFTVTYSIAGFGANNVVITNIVISLTQV